MNIIKVILILCMVLAIDNIAAKDEKVNGTPILIQVELANPYYKGQIYRFPRKSLSMSYSDHTINFDNVSRDYILSVIDDENRQVYTTLIPTGTKTCELPSMLKGVFTIKMTTSSFTYSGEIDL